MYGDLTNRVVLDKPLTVISMNGYASTIIQGAWDAATNGPASVRCAWLTNGAALAGFTLQGGATRGFALGQSQIDLDCGGAAWCSTNSALVENCLVRSNSASYLGGAIYQGTINNCAINNNVMLPYPATYGGTVYRASLNDCTVTRNVVLGTGLGGGFTVATPIIASFGATLHGLLPIVISLQRPIATRLRQSVGWAISRAIRNWWTTFIYQPLRLVAGPAVLLTQQVWTSTAKPGSTLPP